MNKRKAMFTMDCLNGNYEGFTSGDYWNGWACPTFHIEVVKEIIEDMKECWVEMGEELEVDISSDRVRVFMSDCGEWDEFEIDKDSYCAFGSHSWCWYEAMYSCRKCEREFYFNQGEMVPNYGFYCDECKSGKELDAYNGTSLWETNLPIDDFVAKVSNLLDREYGDTNTYGIDDWDGYIMYFSNEEGQEITIDERTLEIKEV